MLPLPRWNEQLPYPSRRFYLSAAVGLALLWLFVHFWSAFVRDEQTRRWSEDGGRSALLSDSYGVDRPRTKRGGSELNLNELAFVHGPTIEAAEPPAAPAPLPPPVVVLPSTPPAAEQGTERPPPAPVFPKHQATSALQRQNAIAAGCTEGAPLASRRASYVRVAGRDEPMLADVGEVMTVASSNPVSGDFCDVIFDHGGKPASIAVADIGPRASVEAEIAERPYFRTTSVHMGDLKSRILQDARRRAVALGLSDSAALEALVDKAMAYVEECSQLTREDYDAAFRQFFKTLQSNDTLDRYRNCISHARGARFEGAPAPLYVMVVSLRDETNNKPYQVRLEYAPRPLAPIEGPTTADQIFMDEFDAYGVGNYAIQ